MYVSISDVLLSGMGMFIVGILFTVGITIFQKVAHPRQKASTAITTEREPTGYNLDQKQWDDPRWEQPRHFTNPVAMINYDGLVGNLTHNEIRELVHRRNEAQYLSEIRYGSPIMYATKCMEVKVFRNGYWNSDNQPACMSCSRTRREHQRIDEFIEAAIHLPSTKPSVWRH